MATNLNQGRGEIDRALQMLPIKLTKIGRTAINGSFFNFYLCQFQGNVILRRRQGRPDQVRHQHRRRTRCHLGGEARCHLG